MLFKFRILILLNFFILSASHSQSVDAFSQNVTLHVKEESLENVLKKLSELSDLKFFYSDNRIPIGKKLTFNYSGSLKKLFDDICDENNLTYTYESNNVALTNKIGQAAPSSKDKFTMSGYVKDGSTGEALIGAALYFTDLQTGTVTNNYGFYSLTIAGGDHQLRVSYMGYTQKLIDFKLQKSQTLNIELIQDHIEIGEAVVYSKRPDANVTDVAMSRNKINIERIKSIPAIFGEVDVLKALLLLPGIQSAGEGTSGLFVRGGSADQTLILLDEAPVYNASHLFGFFSVFNSDAIKDVEVYKGGIPAQYGGRLSSLVDIRMKEGNSKRFSATGGLGLISSRLTLEAPIVKNKGSFMIAGRRTYVDVVNNLATWVRTGEKSQMKLYFYDLNAKANYSFNDKNTLFLSGYFGRDVLGITDNFGINWGNFTGTLRWNHIFTPRLFLNTTVLYSKYDYGIGIDAGPQKLDWKSNLEEVNTKLDFNYFLNPNNEVKFGYNIAGHKFSPAKIDFRSSDSFFQTFKLDTKYALEHAFYLSNAQKITENFTLEYGLRYSLFQNIGPGREFNYEDGNPADNETITDTIQYKRFENIKLHHGAEPRIAARYLMTPSTSLKLSYTRMRQYLQIASNSTAGIPIDRWVSSDKYIKPQIADQVALGLFKNFNDNAFEASVEVYYKKMQNQIDFKEEAEILLNNNLETEIRSGRAWAYGAEFMVKKNVGKMTGWVSYTLSKAQRQINGINNNKAYSPRYDRPHNISTVLSYQLTKRITLAGNWVFTSGSAVSFPKGMYEMDGRRISYYDGRNQNRMPNYHRMDFSVNIDGKNKHNRKWKGSWNFSIYNLYSAKNAFTIQFREVYNNNPNISSDGRLNGEYVPITSVEQKAVKTYLFRLIPSVTYNFKF